MSTWRKWTEYLLLPLIKGVRNSKWISQAQNTSWSWGTHCHRMPSVTKAQHTAKAQLNTILEKNPSKGSEDTITASSEAMGHRFIWERHQEHYGKTMNLTYPMLSGQHLVPYHINKPTCCGPVWPYLALQVFSVPPHPPPLPLPRQQWDVSECYLHGISTPSHIITLSYWYYVHYNITNHRQIRTN